MEIKDECIEALNLLQKYFVVDDSESESIETRIMNLEGGDENGRI